MNTVVVTKVIGASPEEKRAIRNIIDQLVKNNYTIVNNCNVKGRFSRSIPMFYKKNKTFYISGPIIAINPNFYVEKRGVYKFKIRPRK